MKMRACVGSALLVATVTAACGSSAASPRLSKVAYEKAVQKVGVRLARDQHAAYAPVAAHGGSDNIVGTLGQAKAEKIARQVETAYDRAAASLHGLHPPTDAVAGNEKLATGVRAWGAYQRKVILATPAARPGIGKAFTRTAAYRNLFAGIHDLQRKGYNLGFLTDRFFVGS